MVSKHALTRLLICVSLSFSLSLSARAAQPVEGLLAQGQVDEAIAALQKKISLTPGDADSHNLLCRAYYQLGNWDRAIPECEKAVAIDSNSSLFHMWLGRVYGEKADTVSFFSAAGWAKKLDRELETAVRLDPNSAEARTDLAEFYLEAPGIVGGGRDKAEAQAQALMGLNPQKAHWVRGRVAEKKKDLAAAEKEYRAGIEATHGSNEAWLQLAIFFRHTARLSEMEDAVKQTASAPLDRPDALVDAADTLIRSDRSLVLATQLLRRYLTSGSMVEQAPAFKAHYLLGLALEKQGDKASAAQEYRASLALARGYARAQTALRKLNG